MHPVAAAEPDTERTWPIVWKAAALALVLFVVGVVVVFPTLVVELVLPDQTMYADGFSEERFARVRVGMTEQEVLAILGPPQRVSETVGPRVYETSWAEGPSAVVGAEYRWWAYSQRGRLIDSYQVRAVKLSAEGKVLEILHRRYDD